MFLAVAALGGAQETSDSLSADTNAPGTPDETTLIIGETTDETPEGDTAAPDLPGLGAGDFVRMIFVLGGLIALIYGFFWLLKRFSGVRNEGEEALRIIAARSLKGDSSLHLVEVGRRIFLIGSASGAVNLIAEIDDKETVDNLKLQSSRAPGPQDRRFLRYFRDRFGAGPREDSPEKSKNNTSTDDPGAFLRGQRERIKEL